MQQFMQSAANLQQQVLHGLRQGEDMIVMSPMGQTWWDWLAASPPAPVPLHLDGLVVVVYPEEDMLQQQMLQWSDAWPHQPAVAALLPEMPPHTQRDQWEAVLSGRVSLLCLSARKFQSLPTLSQLVRHPRIQSLVVIAGERILPGYWGPQSRSDTMADWVNQVQSHWEKRPPLCVFTRMLSPRLVTPLSERYGLHQPRRILPTVTTTHHHWQVHRAVTGYQKWQHLQRLLPGTSNTGRHRHVVVYHRRADRILLEARLQARAVTALHQELSGSDRLSRLAAFLDSEEGLLLVEETLLTQLPARLCQADSLQFIHWQMPWSVEDLFSTSAWPSINDRLRVDTHVLYTKEDFLLRRQRLKQCFAHDRTMERLSLEQLRRCRQVLVQSTLCRQTQLEHWGSTVPLAHSDCGGCDNCRQTARSSFWTNLVARALY